MAAEKLDPNKAFLGAGLAFPPQADVHGNLATVAYEEDIRQAIRVILGTNPGERVMRPDFGAGL
ncbi:MAG: GPW/gp25 family protein, partial [Bryobacterales bacterium]|nr:GPW/gp25 family protein [Bryobacterales bacterium]